MDVALTTMTTGATVGERPLVIYMFNTHKTQTSNPCTFNLAWQLHLSDLSFEISLIHLDNLH